MAYIDDNFTYYHFEHKHYYEDQIQTFLGIVGIEYEGSFNFSKLKNADENKLYELYNKTFNNNLTELFHDKYAVEVLTMEERFCNLNLYLQECFECIKAGRKIASAILLRSCVQILVDMYECKAGNLEKSIDKFITSINQNSEFAMFSDNNKQKELEEFLVGIKNIGNDAVHLNGKNIRDFIEKYDNQEIFKLFCIVIEHSILKDDIRQRNEDDKNRRIQSIDLTIKEKFIHNNISLNLITSENDEIPF